MLPGGYGAKRLCPYISIDRFIQDARRLVEPKFGYTFNISAPPHIDIPVVSVLHFFEQSR
jgi:hypothetical protein